MTEETWDEEMPATAVPSVRGKSVDVTESFEMAIPVAVNRVAEGGLNGAHAITDPEQHVLGCCLLDDGATLDAAIKVGLTSADFYSPANAAIYLALFRLREQRIPIALDTLMEEMGPKMAEVGGITYLMALDDPIAIGSTTRASHYIKVILKESAKRRRIQQAQRVLENPETEDASVPPPEKPPTATITLRKPSEFLIPPDDDKSVLLGNRFLNRGDGGILVGSSGMGKSSAAIQMSVSWSLGLPFQGIKCNGALRILIIQSEDSDGDIAEVMLSMRHMMELTQDQIEQVDNNVRIVSDRVNRGRAFISSLKSHIASHKPDLVIINPLQAFIDGDVTDSRDLGQFLREGLNGLNDSSFGYILIHHTTKPATGKDKATREWHEVMYDMAGGAELINWARFIISLRATPTEGDFNFVLAKRGRRAGVTRLVNQGIGQREEPVTTIPVRHAHGSIPVAGRAKPVSIIYWEGREPDTKEAKSLSSGGAPEKFPFSQYVGVFPSHSSPGLVYSQLKNALDSNGPIKNGSFANVLKKWEEQEHIERITFEGQPTRYRRLV